MSAQLVEVVDRYGEERPEIILSQKEAYELEARLAMAMVEPCLSGCNP